MRYSFWSGLLLALAAVLLCAEDWSQFRRPTGQGSSSETGLSFEWSESRNIKWKKPVAGLGWSSPVIANGRVWLTTSLDDQGAASLRAIAFDAETGREAVNAEVFRLADAKLA